MKKMYVVICDNNIDDAIFYQNMFINLGKKQKIDIRTTIYKTGQDLLTDLKNTQFKKKIDVIFYAIEDENDVNTLLSIRSINYVGLLLFLGRDRMILSYEEIFDTNICNFIRKSHAEKDLDRLMKISAKIIQKASKVQSEKIVLSYAGEIRQIEIRDILYFEVKERSLVVHYGNNQVFTFISTLSKIENQLKGRKFMRISRFFLVSLEHITRINSKSVIMSNHEEVPLGRKYYKELKSTLEKIGE
ncbi:MAG: LytR/AlgR family response regulator transcription factor [Coprobacillaceae bacterium]